MHSAATHAACFSGHPSATIEMVVYRSSTPSGEPWDEHGYTASDRPTLRLIASAGQAYPARPSRTRYARVSDSDVWLEAPHKGFVGAVIDAMEDGRDRIVLAWPSRPDNGFVAAALALREARATSRLPHGTLALWPWRSGATYAARSILVSAEDICQVARRKASAELYEQTHARLAHEALCLVELRLQDILPSRADQAKPRSEALPVHHPTLLETTAVFVPTERKSAPVYVPNPDQILRRVRRQTTLSTIPEHVGDVGDPLGTPFAIMGLRPTDRAELTRCLHYERFVTHGLDAVIVDLTRTARRTLAPDWQRQLLALLIALDIGNLSRRPPIVILCEDAFTMRTAEFVVRKHSEGARSGRRLLKQGALLLETGILEVPGMPSVPELLPMPFVADVKDASLAPLRDRLIGLSRRLREAGQANAAIAVARVLHALSTFASLPLGLKEARDNASVLFDGDGREEVAARSEFFPTFKLQLMAEIASAAPEFAEDIRVLSDEVWSRVCSWERDTPVSLKLSHLLTDPEWNAHDVLLVMPDACTADVFLVSDLGVSCACTIIEASQIAKQASLNGWRRIMIVRPELPALRTLLTTHITPSRVLLLGDAAGVSLISAELSLLASIPEFSAFAGRAEALAAALNRGGADETIDLKEVEYRYHLPTTEHLIDLTQTATGYTGEIVRLTLEGGGRIAYRPGSDVLVFTPDEIRPFRKVAARDVTMGEGILVLRQEIRDRLSDALSRSRKTAAQLKLYHEAVVRFSQRLSGDTVTAKARHVLAAMRAIDSSIGDHEVRNIKRWLRVEPSDNPQQPRAPRDQQRFSVFMKAAGIDKTLADRFWNFAIVPVRAYSIEEGLDFNRRVVQFIMDPEGVAAGTGWREYEGLWQAVVDSVDFVIHKEIL